MKKRPIGFLGEDKIDPNGEIFDYIRELHEYLWRFVSVAMPGASGDLSRYVDQAIGKLENLIPAFPEPRYCKCNPKDRILCRAIECGLCHKCNKPIPINPSVFYREVPQPKPGEIEGLKYMEKCDYGNTDQIVSYLDYLVAQLREILKLKSSTQRHH